MLDNRPLLGLFYLCNLILSRQESFELVLTFPSFVGWGVVGSKRLAYDVHPANKWWRRDLNLGPLGSKGFALSLTALRVAMCIIPRRLWGEQSLPHSSFITTVGALGHDGSFSSIYSNTNPRIRPCDFGIACLKLSWGQNGKKAWTRRAVSYWR